LKDPLLHIIHIHESLKKIVAYTRGGRAAFMAEIWNIIQQHVPQLISGLEVIRRTLESPKASGDPAGL